MNESRVNSILVAAGMAVFVAGLFPARATIYVAPSGKDTNDGLSWSTPKKTIQPAVTTAVADGHSLVLVSNGTYKANVEIVLNAAVAVQAYDHDVTQTILQQTRFVLQHSQARVSGLTIESASRGAKVEAGTVSGCVIRNCANAFYGCGVWMTGGIVTNCVINDNYLGGTHADAKGGAGIYMQGGLVIDSTIQDNVIDYYRVGAGIRAEGGTIERCLIIGNVSADGGGGVYLTGGAILRNCLVNENVSHKEAGGVYVNQGTVENCTITRNQGLGENGGLYLAANGQAVNCILSGNIGASYALRNVSRVGGIISNCCAQPLPVGVGNIDADPGFVAPEEGDFRLSSGSPAVDVAVTLDWMVGAVDVAGSPRIAGAAPDLGAYESFVSSAGSLRVSFTADARRVNAPDEIVFTACVEGENHAGLTYWWDFGNETASGPDLAQVTNTYSAPGIFTVSLTVSNSVDEGAVCVRERYAVVGPLEWYVSPEGSSTSPYADWSSALSDIHWAFANAGSNDTIYLAGRDFNLTETLAVTFSDVTVKGGYTADGGTGPGIQDSARTPTRLTRDPELIGLRLMTIEGAARVAFEDLTVEGGRSYYTRLHVAGAGIRVQNAQALRFVRCRVVGSSGSSVDYLGGEISFNSLHGTAWDQSLLGGGVYLADGTWNFRGVRFGGNNTDRLRIQSGLNNNRENLLGGAIYAANGTHTISNCVFYGNNGSRPYNSTTANHDREGGGIYVKGGVTTVALSTFVHNSNEAVRRTGGTLTLAHSILWDNGSTDVVGIVSLNTCCVGSGSFAGSNGNIGGDPLFVRGLYLDDGSPCRDAGVVTAAAFGVAALTTHTNGVADDGVVDLGYHYEEGLSPDFVDLYVAEDGNDAQAGATPAAPLRTVTRALALARDGTHVHVGTGTYTAASGETFPLVMNRPGLHVVGAGAEQTTFNAGELGQVVTIKGIPVDGRLEGVTITGGSVYRNYGAGIGIWQSRVTLQGCRIMGNTLLRPSNALNWGSEYGAGIGSCLATVMVRDCAVVSNTVNCIAWDGAAMGGGIGIREGSWSIERSVVAFNQAVGNSRSYNYGAGMLIDGGTHRFVNLLLVSNRCNKVGSQYMRAFVGDGAYLLNGAVVSFENATIAHNEGQGVFSENAGAYPPAVCAITNSIVWGNSADVLGKDTANKPMQITHAIGLTGSVSVAWSNIQEAHAGEGNQMIEPAFAAFGDYHLQSRKGRWMSTGWVRDGAHSHCIDAGYRRTPVGDEPAPNGNRINLGAYGGTAQASLSLARGSVLLLR